MNVRKKASCAILLALCLHATSHAQSTSDLVGAPVKRQEADAQVAIAVPKSEIKKTWAILPSDGRLAVTLERWAKAAGMKLIWDAKQHVMLSSADTFQGTFVDALERVLSSPAIRRSAYPLEACIYPNNPALVRVTQLGEQTECPQ